MGRRKSSSGGTSDHGVVELVEEVAYRRPDAEQAMEKLYQMFNPLAITVASSQLPWQHHSHVEDITQEIWFKVWEGVKPVASIGQFIQFLKIVSKNATSDYRTAENQRAAINSKVEVLPEQKDSQPTIDQALFIPIYVEEDLKDLRELLKELREIDRLIILLHGNDLSIEEIKFALGNEMASNANLINLKALQRYRLEKLKHQHVSEILGLANPEISKVRLYRANNKIETFLNSLESGEKQQRLRACWDRFTKRGLSESNQDKEKLL